MLTKKSAVSSSPSILEGSGGADGLVVPLQLVGSGMYDAAYTIQVKIGNSKSFNLQVDTGSSDLWVASTSCSTQPCSNVGSSNLYNPSSTATQTGASFDITYLRGAVSGPIVWDHVQIASYTIDNQALAAATSVTSEPLDSSTFSGILGLALPLNSIIAHDIAPVTDNSPDGAAWASNLFSLSQPSTPPSSQFLSLSLSRPGSDRVPAVLGIGHHPSSIVSDPGKIQYSTVVSDAPGTLYWKVSVRAITVYVDSQPKPISIGRSNSGAVFPTAVLDSGIPYILTTSKVANAIYGALGIGPAADGNYYVPCTTPINMTISLDNRPEITLHPLDLSAEPVDNNQAQYCTGMIQVSEAALSNTVYGIGDMVLGVPFLRNTYTVMAYTTPFDNGSFPTATTTQNEIHPQLGLLPLTDPQIALDEFHTVRLLNQPLSSANGPHPSSGGSSESAGVGGPTRRVSVGVVVLLGLIGFFSLCCALFGLRWFLLKRRFRRIGFGSVEGGGRPPVVGEEKEKVSKEEILPPSTTTTTTTTTGTTTRPNTSASDNKKPTSYTFLGTSSFEDVRLEGTPAGTPADDDDDHDDLEKEDRGKGPTPRELFQTRRIGSEYTMDSSKTRVEEPVGEFGGVVRKHHDVKDSWGTKVSLGSKWSAGEDTLNGGSNGGGGAWGVRGFGGGGGNNGQPNHHERNQSLLAPLLSFQHRRSQSFGSSPEREMDMGEFGYRPTRVLSHEVEEDGANNNSASSMAGVGSAARTRRRLDHFDALPFPRTSSYYSMRGSIVDPRTSTSARMSGAPEFPPALEEQPPEDDAPLEPLPLPPPPPPPLLLPSSTERIPFPSMSGLRTNGYRRPTSWLDEFDPYLEPTT